MDADPTPTPTPTPTPPRNGLRLVAGGLFANGVASAVVLGSVLFARLSGVGSGIATSIAVVNLMLVPVLIGLIAAWWWRRIPISRGAVALHALWLTALGLAGAYFAFSEGIVCLVMASPLHYLSIAVSLGFGHQLFTRSGGRLRFSVLPFAAAALVLDAQVPRAPARQAFTDEVRIQAPPDKVWPHVVSFAPIPAPADFWVFRLGLPYPVETPPGADAVGKERLCVFSGGVVFKERVTAFEPGRRLAFDIVEQPDDPELLGHFESHSGEFLLRDGGDGTTTLVGKSTYTLHVRPHWYFDWWTRHLGRAVHLRVMENARRLAEAR